MLLLVCSNQYITVVKALELSSSSFTEEFLSGICIKFISVNYNGTSKMSGFTHGFQKHLEDDILGFVFTYCIAHCTELALLDSIKSENDSKALTTLSSTSVFSGILGNLGVK